MSHSEHQIGKAVEASIGVPAGKAGASDVTLFYDENCGLCRHLAHLISRSSEASGVLVKPSPQSVPQELVVMVGERRYAGKEAWAWLVEHHSFFKEWNWLATKLGLRDESVALVAKSTELLRRFCGRCRRSTRL